MAENIKWYGKRVFTLATEANITAMKKAAFLVESDVKQNFTLQGTYQAYRRSRSTGPHWSSAPGEPPAIDIGTLRSSIMHEVEVSGTSVDGRVGPDIEKIAKALRKRGAKADLKAVNYGLYLEMGTVNMAPRPYLRPAIKRTSKKVVKIFKEANS